ncbi:sensor histidine kinase [Actinomadura vinacea]
MARRFSSIRTWIVLLILVPLTSLTALWAFATGITYGDARQLQQSNQFQEKGLLPTQRLIDALQKERRISLGRLGGSRTVPPSAVAAQRAATDRARAEVRRHAADRRLRNAIDPPVVKRLDVFVSRLPGLEPLRRGVDARTTDRSQVLEEFSGMIDAAFALYSSVAPADARIASQATTLIALARAREFLSREDALLTGAAPGGNLTVAERAQFAQLVGAQRHLFTDYSQGLTTDLQERLRNLFATPESTHLRRLEDQLVRGAEPTERTGQQRQNGPNGRGGAPGGPDRSDGNAVSGGTGAAGAVPAVDAASWRAAADTVAGRLFAFENTTLDTITERAEGIAFGVVRRLALAGGTGLLAIVFSIVIAVRISRRLLGESRTLATGVRDFSRRTLPMINERAKDGQPIERIDDDVPDYDYRINEIRDISESFLRARDAVLVSAARELEIRNGLSEVFVNLARRNQALLHRQLSLLDTMERRTEDPAELSDLFRLDHLATRMRRHAEGLVILAGKSAGRGWRRPVPVVDVVRGAVAEVEDYPRVRVQPLPRVALQGTAVADVVHLLAEIVENATTYSPPQSPVRVSGHTVANGLVVEVEDRGLGMTEHDLMVANERLVDPPEFDPSDSARLGLFVVARLARRHGITVTLRQSPYGGTTAIALIPAELITEVTDPEPAARRATGPLATLPEHAGVAAGGAGQGSGPVRLVSQPPPADPGPALTAAPPPPSVPPSVPPPATPPAGPPMPVPERSGDRPSAGSEAGQERPLADGELPRRRRQTHIAPQLRERVDADLAAERDAAAGLPEPSAPLPAPVPPSVPEPAVPNPPTADGATRHDRGTEVPDGPFDPDPEWPDQVGERPRTPEEMKSIMSSMQRGWERGRSDSGQAETGRSRAEEDDTP